MTRQRSPNYPALSLPESLQIVSKIHKANRTNIIARETAAKDAGYSGLTGRSLTVLASLGQYGLVEKAGKGEIRVTRRAVEIMHPIEEQHRAEAIAEAANAPSLFKELHDRFTDGIPSQNALRSFLVQREFNDAAIGQVVASFLDTNAFAENEKVSERNSASADEASEPEGSTESKDAPMTPLHAQPASPTPHPVVVQAGLNQINMNIQGDKVHVDALLDSKGLLELEKKIAALKMLLAPIWGDNDTGGEEDLIG